MTAVAHSVILGGTAAYHLTLNDHVTVGEAWRCDTPYGRSPTFYLLHPSPDHAVWFSSRHGETGLDRSARFVNHRATLWSVMTLGVAHIFSWNGVAAFELPWQVGDCAVPQRVMDWTRHRQSSFGAAARYDATPLRQASRTIDHLNCGDDGLQTAAPFAEPLRAAILAQLPAPVQRDPTYLCTEGPRLETAAEIDLAARLGADVVGMTLCPELWLAAELGLAYASLCIISNFATGRWHHDPRRDFGVSVAVKGLTTLLAASAVVA